MRHDFGCVQRGLTTEARPALKQVSSFCGLEKRRKPAKHQHSPLSASWSWAQCESHFSFCYHSFPVNERLCLRKPQAKGNLSYHELLLVGYWSWPWAWINWILLRMPDSFYKRRNWCSTERGVWESSFVPYLGQIGPHPCETGVVYWKSRPVQFLSGSGWLCSRTLEVVPSNVCHQSNY